MFLPLWPGVAVLPPCRCTQDSVALEPRPNMQLEHTIELQGSLNASSSHIDGHGLHQVDKTSGDKGSMRLEHLAAHGRLEDRCDSYQTEQVAMLVPSSW